jgi:isopentenyl phosphate kinase
VYGDTVFDSFRGGTILSTEDCFFYMARYFKPDRILLAGLEEGVWLDFPQREHLLPEIDLRKGKRMSAALEGSAAVDVTGGMAEKVRLIGILVSEIPGLHAEIFSGTAEGSLYRSLLGEQIGTRIHA